MEINKIYTGDALEILSRLPDHSVDCCVTSPPYYGLRDYGVAGQIGLENSPEMYVNSLVAVFGELWRVLKSEGTLWLNIADSYAGSGKGAWKNKTNIKQSYIPDPDSPQMAMPKQWDGIKTKDLIGIPWLVAFALRGKGWYLRQEIIWHKPNAMPESVKDRCTKAYESIFLLSKQHRYYFDHSAIMEEAKYDGRKDTVRKGSKKYSGTDGAYNPQTINTRPTERWTIKDGKYMRSKRNVWTVPTKPLKDAHFAPFPETLITDCIKAGCPENGIVVDPFMGSGTTGIAARKLNRNYIGIELNPVYVCLAENRIERETGGLFNGQA